MRNWGQSPRDGVRRSWSDQRPDELPGRFGKNRGPSPCFFSAGHPGHECFLKRLGAIHATDSADGILGWNAIPMFDEYLEPRNRILINNSVVLVHRQVESTVS
jgi:hypothetical protein